MLFFLRVTCSITACSNYDVTSIITKLPKGVVEIVMFNPFSMFCFYTPGNIKKLSFSDVFREYRSKTLVENELKTNFFKAIADKCNRVTSPKVPGNLTVSNDRVKSELKLTFSLQLLLTDYNLDCRISQFLKLLKQVHAQIRSF